jgi:4-alpha-glucanotransferase
VTDDDRRPLDRLAAHYGIEPEFTDNWQRRHQVADATKRALLGALGVPAESAAETEASLQATIAAEWQQILAPVTVLRARSPVATTLSLPAEARGRLAWTVAREDGARDRGEIRLDALELAADQRIDGVRYQRRRLRLPLDLPEGYHRLEIMAGGGAPAAMALTIVPERAFSLADLGLGRLFGVTLPLYGLRSERNWGIGDFADLAELAAAMARLGAGLIGINPVHALFPPAPERISPYSPSSRRFLNVLLISVERAVRRLGADIAGDPATEAALARARAADLVDYPEVAELKLQALAELHQGFGSNVGAARAAFESFRSRGGPSLERQAIFEALLEHFIREEPRMSSWRRWPAGYRQPDSREVAAFAKRHAERVEFFQFLQWLADEQLAEAHAEARAAGMPVGLYLDLAVGVDPDGAEAWADPKTVAGRVRIGAPPDDFSPKGQDWGLAPLAPLALRAQAYAPFVELLRRNMAHAGGLRVDHVLGLRRSFWLPPDRDLQGAYVRYPLSDLLGLIALEAERARCVVIGEDLGTVPEGFRETLSEAGLLGCRVLYFERDRDGSFRRSYSYPSGCLASVSTHDLPTLAGFWTGRDIEWRERLCLFAEPGQSAREQAERAGTRRRLLELLAAEGLLPPRLDPARPPRELPWSLVLALHRLLARSPAEIVVMQLEDALQVVEQANLPGTTAEHPNWRRRLEVPLERLGAEPRVVQLAREIQTARVR